MSFNDPHLTDGGTEEQSQTGGRAMNLGNSGRVKHTSLTGHPALGTHQHLPAGHEVGALADPLEDVLQLGADEAIVLGNRGVRKQ